MQKQIQILCETYLIEREKLETCDILGSCQYINITRTYNLFQEIQALIGFNATLNFFNITEGTIKTELELQQEYYETLLPIHTDEIKDGEKGIFTQEQLLTKTIKTHEEYDTLMRDQCSDLWSAWLSPYKEYMELTPPKYITKIGENYQIGIMLALLNHHQKIELTDWSQYST